jgi:hypothetical protein
MITLKQAAEHTGKTKATVLKQIQKGRIRAEKNMMNEWRIDAASLFQIYPAISSELVQENRYETTRNSESTVGNTHFDHEIALLKEKLTSQQTLIDGLKADKEFLQGQLQSSARLLEDMRVVKATEKSPERNKGFWAGLLGKVR